MEEEKLTQIENENTNSAVGSRGVNMQTFTEIKCVIDVLYKQAKDRMHMKALQS